MKFIAHVTDAFEKVHRVVIDRDDKRTALADALAQIPKSVRIGIRREDSPQTVAGELVDDVERRLQ